MALMPGVIHQLVTGPGDALMTRYDVVCVHTIVGYAPASAAHFSVKADGTIIQSRDTRYQSAANYYGNYRVIAIENEDYGPRFGSWSGSDVPYLTPEQVESNARIAVWAHQTHGVPLQLCPDSRPTSRGIGYHRLGIDGNFGSFDYGGRVSGGEVWTKYPGKGCPGDRRITQVLDDVIPRARVLAGLQQEVDLDAVQAGQLAGLDRAAGVTFVKTGRLFGDVLLNVEKVQAAHTAALAALSNDQDITAEEIEAIMNRAVAEHTPTAEAVGEATANALRPMLAEDIGPIVRELFAETLAGDDEAEADAITDKFMTKLAAKLATEAVA